MTLNFRLLRAGEIDCRIGSINNNGLSLLLYKDARCDMTLLDETVGPMNWERKHSRDNANCTVSIYDSERGEWVSKEDVGTESYTEAAKGLASDSFKRACVNWGIGRELYTAPFIWVRAGMYQTGTPKNGNPTCKDRFKVAEIQYNDNRGISKLVIQNCRSGEDVYRYEDGRTYSPRPEPEQKPKQVPKPERQAENSPQWICAACGNAIKPVNNNGEIITPKEIADRTIKKYGKPVCMPCAYKINGNTR